MLPPSLRLKLASEISSVSVLLSCCTWTFGGRLRAYILIFSITFSCSRQRISARVKGACLGLKKPGESYLLLIFGLHFLAFEAAMW